MRLSKETKVAIVELFRKHFPEGKLYLFGSRVDPNARGGDIDLLCEQDGDADTLIKKKFTFLRELENKIGEQQIDFVLYRPTENPNSEIAKIAISTGVRLV